MRVVVIAIIMLIASCTQQQRQFAKGEKYFLRWRALTVAADDATDAFDNGRRDFSALMRRYGVDPIELSAEDDEVGKASIKSVVQSIKKLKAKGSKDACLVHMTSHGTPRGLVFPNAKFLDPGLLDKELQKHCKSSPTVLLMSGCFSGVYASRTLQRSNRIILTAARDDRTSFGCGTADQYTFWDQCLLQELPLATRWHDLADRLRLCIEMREAKEKVDYRSYPQAFVGDAVKDLAIFNRRSP